MHSRCRHILNPLHICHPSSEVTKKITGLLHVQELQLITFRKGVHVIGITNSITWPGVGST